MDIQNLETAQKRKIGIKQSLKTIKNDQALALYIAKDAEQYVVRSIVKLAEEKQLPIIYIESMLILGKACNIDVGAATAVIVK
jgi:large subunit ribosomal protein L7A